MTRYQIEVGPTTYYINADDHDHAAAILWKKLRTAKVYRTPDFRAPAIKNEHLSAADRAAIKAGSGFEWEQTEWPRAGHSSPGQSADRSGTTIKPAPVITGAPLETTRNPVLGRHRRSLALVEKAGIDRYLRLNYALASTETIEKKRAEMSGRADAAMLEATETLEGGQTMSSGLCGDHERDYLGTIDGWRDDAASLRSALRAIREICQAEEELL